MRHPIFRMPRRFLRRAAETVLLLVAAASLACGGGGSGGGDNGPAFKCSDSPVGVDTVALVCGTKISGNTWSLKVVIEGPVTSADISGFNFDVVFPASDLSYVPGSAEVGTYFSQGGSVALFAAGLASNDPGRLVVGIQLPDQAVPVQGGPGQNLIMTFRLKANALTAFGPDLIRFENAEAVDSAKAAIESVSFSDQLLLSVQ